MFTVLVHFVTRKKKKSQDVKAYDELDYLMRGGQRCLLTWILYSPSPPILVIVEPTKLLATVIRFN